MHYVTGDIFTLRPPRQSLKAWSPFWDCVDILFQFQNSDISDGDEELPEWRISWIAGLSLLRAIGHVLAKVDANISEESRYAISELWKRMRDNKDDYAIFWNFIELERNSILKAYEFGASFRIGPDGPQILMSDDEYAFQKFRLAVYWWRHELMALEAKLDA